jgi:hypothetical protein
MGGEKKERKFSKKKQGERKKGEKILYKKHGREKKGEKMIENVEEIFKITLVNLRFVEFLILKISKPFFRPRVIKKLKLKKENNILKDNKNGNDDQSYNIIDKSNEKKNFFC